MNEKTKNGEETAQGTDDEGINPLSAPDSYPSHYKNKNLPTYVRYGLVLYLAGVLVLLIASDVGSGVAGVTRLIPEEGDTFSQLIETVLLEASIFTSVRELWDTGSYALSIFIALTSVSWPYVKLFVSFYAWMTPNVGPRRERLLVVLDVLGKWCFVDVVVFIEIMVIFRASIPLGGPSLEVYVVPKWGFFGFVTASMLDLIATHIMLHIHRSIVYPGKPASDPQGLRAVGRISAKRVAVMTAMIVSGIALYLAGFIVHVFRITNSRSQVELESTDYSLAFAGRELGDAGRATDKGAVIWLQILWFGFGLVAPILSAMFQCAVLWCPVNQEKLRQIYTCAEIANAWNCAEVFLVSTIFAVVEVPKFGSGLIDAGCDTCFTVDAELFPELTVLVLGCVVTLATNYLVLRTCHTALY